MRRLSFLLVLVGFATSACISGMGPSHKIPSLVGNRRVLFVGNSHTYVNDLPRILQRLARLAGDTALRTASIAYPNLALEDHFVIQEAPQALAQSDWEFVVMQQGTSAATESQVHLAFWAQQFDPLIRAANAEPVLYQIWPLASQRYLADAALKSYYNATVAVLGIFAPAGDAFTAALAENAGAGVYAQDGLHATYRGTYLAALVLLNRLTDVVPGSLPPTIPGFSEDTAFVRLLRAGRPDRARPEPGAADGGASVGPLTRRGNQMMRTVFSTLLTRARRAAILCTALLGSVSAPIGSQATPDAPTQAAVARDAWRRAGASQRAGAIDSAYADMKRAHAAWPAQTAYGDALARFAARRGDESTLASVLDELSAQEAGATAALDSVVAAVAARSPAVARARDALVARIAPLAASAPRILSADTTFWPEGIDVDPRGGTLYVTSLFHRNVLIVPRSGGTRWLLAADAVPRGAVFGVGVDAERDVVWITTAPLSQLGGSAADTSGRAELLRVEVPSGRITGRYLLGDGRGVPGEIAVTTNGDVLVSDATLGALYRLRRGAERVERIASALLRSPQGIAVSADLTWAVVADWSHGLLRWDLGTDVVEQVRVPADAALLGIDGLRRAGTRLIGVQNGLRPNRVVAMDLDPDGRRVTAVRTLDRPTALEAEPTVGVLRGDRYLYVSSSAWPFWTEEGQRISPEQPRPPVIVRELALPR